jgi:hypothetical protein
MARNDPMRGEGRDPKDTTAEIAGSPFSTESNANPDERERLCRTASSATRAVYHPLHALWAGVARQSQTRATN